MPRPPSRTSLREFIGVEALGALVLLGAAVAALLWANLGEPGHYDAFWHRPLSAAIGSAGITLDLRDWVNDLLMALFFFVVGLEIKRELVDGELRDPRRAALPLIAALGGMVVPALLYLALNPGGPEARGWGIPMATDIAFAVGVLALVGRGLPAGVRVFLLSLAIVDDLGAIAAIAIFYTAAIDLPALGLGVGAIAAFAAAWRRPLTRQGPLLIATAAMAWLGLHGSGVHATIAGVALGLAVPAGRRPDPSAAERLTHLLHPVTGFVVIPLFALANAGIVIPGGSLATVAGHPVTAGVLLGLVVGKPLGITLACYAAVRAGVARLPAGVGWGPLGGTAAVAGIGFTVSLFIGQLAFSDAALRDAAKIGVLGGSLASAAVGAVVLAGVSRRSGEQGSPDTAFHGAEPPS